MHNVLANISHRWKLVWISGHLNMSTPTVKYTNMAAAGTSEVKATLRLMLGPEI